MSVTTPTMTYRSLEHKLKRLGFAVEAVPGKSRTYRHAGMGAVIPLAERPLDSTVLPQHLAAVQGVLQGYGIGDLEAVPDSATTEREVNELVRRAFFLGARLALASRGLDLANGDVSTL